MSTHRRFHAFIPAATLAGVLALSACSPSKPEIRSADASNPALVNTGKALYDRLCASCHGAKLEGQPEWQSRKSDGKLPAPPHDASGHTWHHDDATLFDITRNGLAKYGGPDYRTDMPKFEGVLKDEEIWAVLAYIKSTWPTETAQHQASLNRPARP